MPANERMPESDTGAAVKVSNNQALSRFEARVAGKIAFLDYRRTSAEIMLTHAETPAELEGRGIASEITRTALEFARAHGLTVVPLCPFVSWYVRQHPEFADLVKRA